MEATNPKLIGLYRAYADSLRRGDCLSYEVRMEIDKLSIRPVVLSEITENKETAGGRGIVRWDQRL